MTMVKNEFSRKATGMETAILYILISVLFSTIGQLLLKSGMNSIGAVTLEFQPAFLYPVADGHQPSRFLWIGYLCGRDGFLVGGAFPG